MPVQAIIFGCEGPSLSSYEKKFFADVQPWGFILFARNLQNPDQISRLTEELRTCVGRQAPILIDQEGGRVARLQAPHWQDWLPPLDHIQKVGPANSGRAMWLRYRIIAAELTALGIDVNCAPMADIPAPGVHAIIRNRCYGFNAKSVAVAGRAVADGLLAGSVLPVLKHIPGHGRPTADSHVELPGTSAPLADLQSTDFAAFKMLCDLPMAMTAHVVYSALDPDRCATLSPDVIRMIRRDIGFDGLLMTDDISMSALSGTLADRVSKAYNAGCDMILHCNGFRHEMTDVVGAARALEGQAAGRAKDAMDMRQNPQEFDTQTALAELAQMTMVAANE